MNTIRRLRKEFGMTMKELGQKLGVSESTISLYETGKRQPDNSTILAIADLFNVTTDYLLGREEPAAPTLDEQLSDIDFALSGEIRDLTDDEKQDILDYVRFKRSQKNAR